MCFLRNRLNYYYNKRHKIRGEQENIFWISNNISILQISFKKNLQVIPVHIEDINKQLL